MLPCETLMVLSQRTVVGLGRFELPTSWSRITFGLYEHYLHIRFLSLFHCIILLYTISLHFVSSGSSCVVVLVVVLGGTVSL